jgi:HK97 family phage major capsid protein
MTLQISNNSAAAIMEASAEAGILSSKSTLTKAEDRRFSYLLMHIGLLKNGLSSRQIAGIETERIMKEAGLVTLPHALPDDVEKEWRMFLDHKARTHFNRPVKHEIQQISGEELRQQEAGAQGVTQSTGAAGGFWVPAGFSNRQIASMRAYDAIFDSENHNHIDTLSGGVISIPGLDDVANSSTLIGENVSPGPGSNFVASTTQLNAYSFRSGFIFVTLELLADSGVPIGALLETAIAVRHARSIGSYMMIGSGVNQPRGLVTAALAAGAPIVVAQGDAFNNGLSSDTGANSIGTEDMALLFG